uniref:Uncharacterized protein n=1 Tax=Anopheles coluzzii TaxID=1518534 RepID=A0A8W7PXE3_ANOCL
MCTAVLIFPDNAPPAVRTADSGTYFSDTRKVLYSGLGSAPFLAGMHTSDARPAAVDRRYYRHSRNRTSGAAVVGQGVGVVVVVGQGGGVVVMVVVGQGGAFVVVGQGFGVVVHGGWVVGDVVQGGFVAGAVVMHGGFGRYSGTLAGSMPVSPVRSTRPVIQPASIEFTSMIRSPSLKPTSSLSCAS